MTPLDDFALQQSSSFMVRGFLQALTTTIEEKVEDLEPGKDIIEPGHEPKIDSFKPRTHRCKVRQSAWERYQQRPGPRAWNHF